MKTSYAFLLALVPALVSTMPPSTLRAADPAKPAAQAADKITLASIFTDHAVLQRDMAIPVWGRGPIGAKVTVHFADLWTVGEVDKDGRWQVKFSALPASSESRTLTLKDRSGQVIVEKKDILIGEVWLCSGQSNMGWPLVSADGGKEAAAAAGDNELRLFNVHAHVADAPEENAQGTWAVDAPGPAGGFSAVAYFYGKELRKHLKVPVGLIKSAVGGTVADAWTPLADLETNPTLKPLLEQHARAIENYPKTVEAYKANEAQLLAKYEADAAKFAALPAAEKAKQRAPRKPVAPAHPDKNPNRPYGLYNGSIAPLAPYGIRGAIWYQGESNSGRAAQYRTLFPAMIGGWRRVWGQGDFPFYFVQITPHNGMSPDIREAQRLTTETTQNTAMAATMDIGDAGDIHPKAKQPIGERLALAARALTYGEKVEYSGPTWDTIQVNGHQATLTFKHVGGGLVAKEGALRGFEIAGVAGKFAPAAAEIKGETIVVSSDSVAAPVQVRYGWSTVPEASLWNKSGLPAPSFMTDKVFTLEPGFEQLNGPDLTGWHYANGAPFDGKTEASDGRYTARDGRIVVNPGKGLAQLWTVREFPTDFHLKLEFRAGVNADSGVFLRKPQLQCRDYLKAGPYTELTKYKPQDWNELEVIVKNNIATCTCNGEPLEFPKQPSKAAKELPPTGPIGLEADRGQMEYRRIRIKELK
jgi:sialate O-acetylesterase